MLYEYECPNCDVFERWFTMGEMPQEVVCDVCHTRSPKIISQSRPPIMRKNEFKGGYKHSLAEYPGDPRAFIKNSGQKGREEAIKVWTDKGHTRESITFKGEEDRDNGQ